MKHLLDSIAQEPVSDELRALAEKLQALLDEQAEEASKNA